jgi:hypothetical protein
MYPDPPARAAIPALMSTRLRHLPPVLEGVFVMLPEGAVTFSLSDDIKQRRRDVELQSSA